MKTLLFCLLIFTSISSYATEYYEIINTGNSYSWFTKDEVRVKYIDKHLPNLPKNIRKKCIENKKDHLYYSPKNNHIGFLVAKIPRKKGAKKNHLKKDLFILNILGSYILIAGDGIKKTTKKAYLEFKLLRDSYNPTKFGLTLGKTSFNQAVSILSKAGAKYNDNLAYEGYSDIPIIKIKSHKELPTIDSHRAISASLYFIRDKLYKIAILWDTARVNLFPPIMEKYNTTSRFYKKIEYKPIRVNKYNKDDKYWYFWLNNNINIEVKNTTWTKINKGKYNFKGFYQLSYIFTSLHNSFIDIKSFIDQKIKDKEIEERNRKKQEINRKKQQKLQSNMDQI
jgi:hypothetical protein